LKCDELGKRRIENFDPESPRVIVCEGLHDSGFICALLKHLRIQNCDVTFPKKKEGKDGIADMVRLLSQESTVTGIAVIRDADTDANDAFATACEGYEKPFDPPQQPFVVARGKKTTGIFLMPGRNRTGALEHLLLDAIFATHQALADCIQALDACNDRSRDWSENQKAKMKMQCAIACFCQDNPSSSLGFIWSKGVDNPLDIASPLFGEIGQFLTDFSQ
jgi:hypothetical protein